MQPKKIHLAHFALIVFELMLWQNNWLYSLCRRMDTLTRISLCLLDTHYPPSLSLSIDHSLSLSYSFSPSNVHTHYPFLNWKDSHTLTLSLSLLDTPISLTLCDARISLLLSLSFSTQISCVVGCSFFLFISTIFYIDLSLSTLFVIPLLFMFQFNF